MVNEGAPSVPLENSAQAQAPRLLRAPALSTLCALSALVAAVVSHVLVPGFAIKGDAETWHQVARWGQFFALTSAIAAVVVLPVTMAVPLSNGSTATWSKRLSGVGFAAILLFIVIRAALLSREYTTGQHVFLGLAAAHLLGLSLTSTALFRARHPILRVTISGAFVMTLSALIGQVLELFMQVNLSLTQLEFSRTAHAFGEAGYITALLGLSALLFAHSGDRRAGLARFLGLSLAGMVAAAFFLLQQRLGDEAFGLVLYHSQHVRLLLETGALAYAVPLSLAISAGLSGLLLSRPELHQLALGTLLLVASGYCPRTPLQLIWFALSLAFIARATRAIAFSDPDNIDVPATSSSA